VHRIVAPQRDGDRVSARLKDDGSLSRIESCRGDLDNGGSYGDGRQREAPILPRRCADTADGDDCPSYDLAFIIVDTDLA
jgi:hypothetical protein